MAEYWIDISSKSLINHSFPLQVCEGLQIESLVTVILSVQITTTMQINRRLTGHLNGSQLKKMSQWQRFKGQKWSLTKIWWRISSCRSRFTIKKKSLDRQSIFPYVVPTALRKENKVDVEFFFTRSHYIKTWRQTSSPELLRESY